MTVKKASSTKYDKATSSSSANAIKKGASVLVLMTTNGTTITASKVPFQRGAQSTSKQAGQIPANYSQGSPKDEVSA